MEEDKAAAYYEELSRKGSNAARFKQGLGFASSDHRSTSTTTNFVRAASPTKSAQLDKQAQLQKIHNKLSKASHDRRSRERDHLRRSPSRRSRRSRSRSRSRSPDRRRRDGDRRDRVRAEEKGKSSRDKSGGVDYYRLIDGYEKMTPAERVKARMKFQLSETAAKDSVMGTGHRWERFDFNKDAPLDDDEDELETADDDASLVKNMGKSFRFSAVEAKRDEQIKAAHDEAMFGAPVASAALQFEDTKENGQEEGDNHSEQSSLGNGKKQIENPLLSEKVISMQQSSWRDRARKLHNAKG